MRSTVWFRRSVAGLPAFPLVLWLGTASASAQTPANDGKSLFLAQKCNMCHTVSTAAVEKTGKMTGPDLGNVGSKPDRDAAWIAKYLKGEVQSGTKKHAVRFKGTDEELAAVAAWLREQKQK